jgi:hypothetical protein
MTSGRCNAKKGCVCRTGMVFTNLRKAESRH